MSDRLEETKLLLRNALKNQKASPENDQLQDLFESLCHDLAACAAGPWRTDVENAPKDGSEVVGGWYETDGHFCHNRYGWDARAECWKWDDAKFDLVPFVVWTTINAPVKP